MLYFLNFAYTPNTASYNRLMGYYKSLDKLGVKATVVFLYPNERFDKIQEKYQNINIEYYWKKWIPYRGFFRKFTLQRYINRFISKLVPGDIVYTYSISKMTALCQGVKGVRVFAEVTEHPKASNGFPHPLLALSDNELNNTINKLSGLFVISRPLRDYYINCGLNASKIQIINMTVDETRFSNIKKNKTTKYIAYCGTASNNKDGVNDLIQAFSLVVEKKHDIKLYIIGKTPSKKDIHNNLKLIKAKGLSDKIIFTGLLKSEDIPQLLKDALILVLDRPDTLQAKYGFPTKLGEYLLTGNPVVVTSVGDIPLFLTDGDSALISDPSNPKMFSDKILWALDNYDDALVIGRKGCKIALSNFNAYVETKKLYDFIEKSL